MGDTVIDSDQVDNSPCEPLPSGSGSFSVGDRPDSLNGKPDPSIKTASSNEAMGDLLHNSAYFDMFSGISGDMTLGACVDLGVPVTWLNQQFEKMPLPNVRIRVEDARRNGIRAVNLFVEEIAASVPYSEHDPKKDFIPHSEHGLEGDSTPHSGHDPEKESPLHSERNSGKGSCSHSGHDSGKDLHSHGTSSHPASHSGSRNYEQIRALISASPFSQYVISSSLSAFEKIASAESAIHGTPLEKVHFHEVGGIDAIVDIVGAFLCMEYLGIKEVYASEIPLGSGTVTCCHGIIPVPAPATLKILKGVPVTSTGSAMEMVTPTGAAIITTLTSHFGSVPDMVVGESGYGSGKRENREGLPNLLRIITGNRISRKHCSDGDDKAVAACSVLEDQHPALDFNLVVTHERIHVVTTTIDDMNPEFYGYIMEKLFESGALDVSHIPLQMKKNRPGTRLEAICHGRDLNAVIKVILTESTTAGVRFHAVDRAVLKRSNIEVETSFGPVKAKQIIDPQGQVRIVPEYEVCRRIARETDLPLQDVYKRISG